MRDFSPRTFCGDSHAAAMCCDSQGETLTPLSESSPPSRQSLPMEFVGLGVELEAQELLEAKFDFWGFDTFALSRLSGGRPLQLAGWEALRRSPCATDPDLELDVGKAQRFLQRAESHYSSRQDVPYHNNMHAADVTQTVHALLADFGFVVYIDGLSYLALILSAIVHDLGHDGHSNSFHVNVKDEMALTYNDQSVLENFHVSNASRLLFGEPDTNLLEGFPHCKLKRIRKEMIDNVLGTDMAHHFRHVSTFKAFCEKNSTHPQNWCSGDPAAMTSLTVMVLHAADISNPSKPTDLSDQWTDLLKEEFFRQGDEEKRLGLPVSPLCDRGGANFASSQVGFIKLIVHPTFEAIEKQAPLSQGNALQELTRNVELWEDRKRDEELAEQERLQEAQARLCSKAVSDPAVQVPEDPEATRTPRHGGA